MSFSLALCSCSSRRFFFKALRASCSSLCPIFPVLHQCSVSDPEKLPLHWVRFPCDLRHDFKRLADSLLNRRIFVRTESPDGIDISWQRLKIPLNRSHIRFCEVGVKLI